MKRIISSLLFLFAVGMATPALAQKFGHINSNELILAMPEKAKVEKDIEAFTNELRLQLETMESEWRKKTEEYQKNEVSMTPLIKQTKIREIQELETRIRSFQEDAEDELAKKQAELFQPMIDKAKKAIEEVAKENKFTYIFDTAQGTVLYSPDGDNVLPLVKKKLGITP